MLDSFSQVHGTGACLWHRGTGACGTGAWISPILSPCGKKNDAAQIETDVFLEDRLAAKDVVSCSSGDEAENT